MQRQGIAGMQGSRDAGSGRLDVARRALAAPLAAALLVAAVSPARASETVRVYLFCQLESFGCSEAQIFLSKLEDAGPEVEIVRLGLTGSRRNVRATEQIAQRLAAGRPRTPFIVVGGRVFSGYRGDAITGSAVSEAVRLCQRRRCTDVAGIVLRRLANAPGG